MHAPELRQVAARRLVNQRLEGPPLDAVTAVVSHLCAVQSQDYPVARWSVGQRAAGVDEAAVDAALAAGAIVRTHVLRDTWHLVAREDLRWLLQLTAPRILRRNATMHRREGLEETLLERTDGLLADALRGGRTLTRPELADVLADAGIEAAGFTLTYIVMHAELTATVCSGGMRGKQHTYALVDERVPRSDPLDPDEALARLAARYLIAHGPAQAEDLARWASLPVGEGRRALALAAGELVRETLAGRELWSVPSGSDADAAPPRAHLLQAFDEHVIGYLASREAIDIDGLAGRDPPGGGPPFAHWILLGGQIVGHWRRKATTRTLTIETQLARSLSPGEAAAVEDAKSRYAAFCGLTLA